MPKVEVTLPDQVESEISRLVEQGDFLNREQAVEELLSKGLSAYDTGGDDSPTVEEEVFTQTLDEQRDPAMRDEGDDERTF